MSQPDVLKTKWKKRDEATPVEQDDNNNKAAVVGEGILRTTTNFGRNNIPAFAARSGKKIAFADEVGEKLVENNYVELLHYSPSNSNTVKSPDGCCIIS